jgi:ribosomal protein L27
MNTNVNLFAPIGVMALLGTGFLFFVAALVLIQSLIVRKRGRKVCPGSNVVNRRSVPGGDSDLLAGKS